MARHKATAGARMTALSLCLWVSSALATTQFETVRGLQKNNRQTNHRINAITIKGQSYDYNDNSKRDLQNIVIRYPDDYQPQSEGNVFEDRSTQLVVCQQVPEDALAVRTDVTIHYHVETNKEQAILPEDFLNEEIPALVAATAITEAAEKLCGETGTGTGTNSSSLSDCVISVSAGAPGSNEGNCTASGPDSLSCNTYKDTFHVLHKDECSQDDVVAASMRLVQQEVAGDDFVAGINENLGNPLADEADDLLITKVELVDAPQDNTFAGAQSGIMMEEGGLTAGGKFVIFLTVAATLLVLVALFAWRRHVAYRRRRMDDDLKSIRTDWSKTDDGDNSYLQPDFHDLALRHSKQNVHRCQSATCRVCRPSLGQVHMLSVPRGTNPADGFQLCGVLANDMTYDDDYDSLVPEILCACTSDGGDDNSLNMAPIPEQVVCPEGRVPKKKKGRSSLYPDDPLPPPDYYDAVHEQSSVVEEERRRSSYQFDSQQAPFQFNDQPQRILPRPGKKNRFSNPRVAQNTSMDTGGGDEDSISFVRVANAKRADFDENEPNQEVVL